MLLTFSLTVRKLVCEYVAGANIVFFFGLRESVKSVKRLKIESQITAAKVELKVFFPLRKYYMYNTYM